MNFLNFNISLSYAHFNCGIYFVKYFIGNARDQVTITASPMLNQSQCQSDVTITCRADRLATVFWWINNDPTPVARYTKPFIMDQDFPINITTTVSLQLGFIILLTSSVEHNYNRNNYTTRIYTTVTNLAEKNISKIVCGFNSINATLAVSVKGKGNGIV